MERQGDSEVLGEYWKHKGWNVKSQNPRVRASQWPLGEAWMKDLQGGSLGDWEEFLVNHSKYKQDLGYGTFSVLLG